MLVRVVRRLERGLWIGAIGSATAAAAALVPQMLGAQESPVPKTHTVKRGDTLWDLAKTYLGDSFLWPDIYRVNVDVIEDPHWIYPGEVLKLPGETAKVIAVAPPAAAPQPAAPAPTPTAPVEARPVDTAAVALAAARVETTITPTPALMPADYAVRSSEYAAAPWVEGRGGPKGSGYIVQNGELSAVASADHSRMNLYDPIMIAPPTGSASAGQLFLSYRLGPLIENFGQIVIPTGIIRVTRANRAGEAAVASVVRMFGEVLQGQRLIPYDSTAAMVAGRPSPVTNGTTGKVRWLYEKPVLPSVQSYVVLDIAARSGIRTGDEIEFYQPRQAPVDGRDIAIPEIYIAKAQVLRVTPYGVSAMITGQEQTRIEEGTAVRVAAKMP
jgi:LysM domain-containing protein